MKITSSISAMTRKEIAALYKTSDRAFRTKLKKEGIELPAGLVYPIDIIRIFEVLGWPEGFENE